MSELLFQNQLAQALELLNSNTNVCYSSDFPVCPAAFTDDNSIGKNYCFLGQKNQKKKERVGYILHTKQMENICAKSGRFLLRIY